MRSRSCSLIVSNPPYIPSADMRSLQPEVRDHEPRIALEGIEIDGLGAYRKLASQASRVLKPGGLIAVEVGLGQSRKVEEIFRKSGLTGIEILNDLANIERVVVGKST